MGFVVAFGVGLIMSCLLICQPIALNWDKTLDGECGSTLGLEITFAAVNMVIDAAIVFLPTPVIWRLQMPVKRKIGVSCMFGLGLVICVVNAARIGLVVNSDAIDFIHAVTDVVIFSGLEIWFGIIAACLPTLKPIFKRRGGDTDDIPSSGYRGRDLRRSPSNKLYSSECGAGWELGSTWHGNEGNKSSKTHFDLFNHDDQPLTEGLTFPNKAKKARTMMNPWSHSTDALPSRSTKSDIHRASVCYDYGRTKYSKLSLNGNKIELKEARKTGKNPDRVTARYPQVRVFNSGKQCKVVVQPTPSFRLVPSTSASLHLSILTAAMAAPPPESRKALAPIREKKDARTAQIAIQTTALHLATAFPRTSGMF
ncbi:MAG: hypothetical protein Q9210_003812 [Variospora velana]